MKKYFFLKLLAFDVLAVVYFTAVKRNFNFG